MKQVTKKSLLSFLVVALLAIVCAFGVMGFNRSNTALADGALPEASVYQSATLAGEDEFSIKAGLPQLPHSLTALQKSAYTSTALAN